MASAVLSVQSLRFGFSAKHSLNFLEFSVPTNPFGVSWVSTFPSTKDAQNLKLEHLSKASSEGAPSELIEDSKFVPLNADDPRYGPPVLLLLGFEKEETTKIQELLKELDGEFMKVVHCTEDMITLSLWDAMHIQQTNLEAVKIVKSPPRICFLSGLSGEEMMMFIDAFPETGLEAAIFAALVPNSAAKPIQEVMEEIMGDHEMLVSCSASALVCVFRLQEGQTWLKHVHPETRMKPEFLVAQSNALPRFVKMENIFRCRSS